MPTDALFMPPTPRLRGDKELPPCPDLVGHPQHGSVPFVGGWSTSVHQASQASSTPGTASLLIPKTVRFADTPQHAFDGLLTAGNAYAAPGAVRPVIPRTSSAPHNRVPHNYPPYSRGPSTRTPHNRIPHNVLDGGVGARGDRYTPSDRTRDDAYMVSPGTARRYERPARHVDSRHTWGGEPSYSRSSYGLGDDPFPKISVWRRVARMFFCCHG